MGRVDKSVELNEESNFVLLCKKCMSKACLELATYEEYYWDGTNGNYHDVRFISMSCNTCGTTETINE